MTYIAKALIIGAGVLLVSACGSDSNNEPDNESISDSNTVFTEGLYDVRYCEVFLANSQGDQTVAQVYSTQGLNSCPQEQFDDLDAVTIAEENSALKATLNGPRHWVLDGITITSSNDSVDIKMFGEIEMRHLADLTISTSGAPYTVNSVERDSIWHYSAGREVYELQDPSGTRYIMQSYSLASDANMQADDLAELGGRLTLAEGWYFSSRVLEETLEVEDIGGLADVVKDDLDNTYQRIPSDNKMLSYHEGYWAAEVNNPEIPYPTTVINDMYVDLDTNLVTVYAQQRVMGQVMSPPQVNPGECIETQIGTLCFHPNAVYLNGSGQELDEADGTGQWWVKHAWVLGGEGYYNCEISPQEEYNDCIDVEGVLLEDGLMMQIGDVDDLYTFFNTRTPLLEQTPINYQVIRYGPSNIDPAAGDIDMTPVPLFELTFTCQNEISAFDGELRTCPEIVE